MMNDGGAMQNIIQLSSQLVAIDSINPSLVPGAAGEGEIAAFVADWLQRAGAHVQVVPAASGERPSVLGLVRGAGGGRSLLLYAHLDTVGVTGMKAPHRPTLQGDKLFGRGALDMKGSLAAVMLVAAECARQPLAGDVYIAAVSDEESGSVGMEAIVRHLAQNNVKLDASIVTEPTGLDLCLTHRGFGWATITTHGRAAHAALRGEGIDAIARMGRVLVALEKLDQSLQERPAHPLLEHGAVIASVIRGGTEVFTYPAECAIDLVRRTLPGEDAAAITREMNALLAALQAQDPQFSATFDLKLYRAPLETSADSPIAATVTAMAEKWMGHPPDTFGAPFWTDAGLLAEAGIPTVILGPSGEGAHADIEWVSLSSVQTLVNILTDTARAFCGQ